MAVPIYQVDAFTEEPFKGNPAGVCLLPGPADAAWMQSVAAEMNLAETAFPLPEGDGFRLRWFTWPRPTSSGSRGSFPRAARPASRR